MFSLDVSATNSLPEQVPAITRDYRHPSLAVASAPVARDLRSEAVEAILHTNDFAALSPEAKAKLQAAVSMEFIKQYAGLIDAQLANPETARKFLELFKQASSGFAAAYAEFSQEVEKKYTDTNAEAKKIGEVVASQILSRSNELIDRLSENIKTQEQRMELAKGIAAVYVNHRMDLVSQEMPSPEALKYFSPAMQEKVRNGLVILEKFKAEQIELMKALHEGGPERLSTQVAEVVRQEHNSFANVGDIGKLERENYKRTLADTKKPMEAMAREIDRDNRDRLSSGATEAVETLHDLQRRILNSMPYNPIPGLEGLLMNQAVMFALVQISSQAFDSR